MNKILTALSLNKNILISLSLIIVTIYLLSGLPFYKIVNTQDKKDLINIKNNEDVRSNKNSKGSAIDKTNTPSPNSIGGKYVLLDSETNNSKKSEYKTATSSTALEDIAYFTLYDYNIKDPIMIGSDNIKNVYINILAQNIFDIKYKNNSNKCEKEPSLGYKTWKVKDGKYLIFYCNDIETYAFTIIDDKYGSRLLDESTGKIWIRKVGYTFTYKEKVETKNGDIKIDGKNSEMKEVDRRLSLYSIPACDGRSCPALIEGVFEEKDVNGVYKVVKRVSVEGNASYGEVQIADIETGKAKSVEVGKNKKALAIHWSDLHQGIDVGGEWLLEYSDLKLKKLSQYK